MAHSKRHNRSSTPERSITETAPKASFIMLFTGLFLLTIATAASLSSTMPADLSFFAAPISLFLGIIIGGFYCGKRLEGSQGYCCAAISATIVSAILLSCKLFIPAPKSSMTLAASIISNLFIIISALIGALTASKLPSRRRKRKSKNRR